MAAGFRMRQETNDGRPRNISISIKISTYTPATTYALIGGIYALDNVIANDHMPFKACLLLTSITTVFLVILRYWNTSRTKTTQETKYLSNFNLFAYDSAALITWKQNRRWNAEKPSATLDP